MLLLSLVSIAAAQAPGGISMPELDAQLYRAPIDAERTLWADDTSYKPDGYYGGRLLFNYMNDPLVYMLGEEEYALVKNTLQSNLLGGISYKRVRFGLDLPIYLAAGSDLDSVSTGAGVGDLAFDVKGTILPREENPVGLAMGGRLTIPTSTLEVALGGGKPTGEIQAIVDQEIDAFLVVANLGVRFLPEVLLENTELNDRLVVRLGTGYALNDASGVSLDLSSQSSFSSIGGGMAGFPIEALAGGWHRLDERFVVRGGMGTGLTTGIGAPQFRALMTLAYEPAATMDADLDGLTDDLDACPEQAEDFDGYRDSDGCPDPTTSVTFRVEDASGALIDGANGGVAGEGGEGSEFILALHPGRYAFSASAKDYSPGELIVEVPEALDYSASLVLTSLPATVEIRTSVQGDEAPSSINWILDGAVQGALVDGALTTTIPLGAHEITLRADGFKPQRRSFELTAGEVEVLEFSLEPARVKVDQERIDISEKIFFDSAKATIKPESFSLLDEIAATLEAHPEITKILIEGHTDSQGSASYNQKLSTERAASVRRYLVDKGVDPKRMRSEGFGESRPIASNETKAGQEENRRVVFSVLERAEAAPAVTPEPAPEPATEEDDKNPW